MPALYRRAKQSDSTLQATFPPEAGGISLRTDPIAVQQILLNLVDNACKYGKGEIALAIRCSLERLEFQITDNGAGISSDAGARLFEAFNKSKSDAVPGIGLGLFLSRRLARDLGGDLSNVPTDVGARFLFSLPIE